MLTQEILIYIQAELHKNTPEPAIRQALVSGGWKAEDIDAAFGRIRNNTPLPAATGSAAPKTGSKKTCLIVGAIGCVAGVVGLAVFGVIAGIVLVAVNPAAQLEKARGAMFRNDFTEVYYGIHRHYAETGNYPQNIKDLDVMQSGMDARLGERKESFRYQLSPDGYDFQLCGSVAGAQEICAGRDTDIGSLFTGPESIVSPMPGQ